MLLRLTLLVSILTINIWFTAEANTIYDRNKEVSLKEFKRDLPETQHFRQFWNLSGKQDGRQSLIGRDIFYLWYETTEVGDDELLSRQKRGWVSIIIYGTSLATTATAFGMTLSAALSDGCDPVSGYKSICEDRDAIDRMHREILDLKAEYDRRYLDNKKEFLDLRTSSSNNAYVQYYIDEAVQKVQDLTDLQEIAYDTLQVQMPKLFQMYLAAGNYTSEQYLQSLINPLEVSLSDIKNMVEQQKKNQLIGLAIQFVAEMLLNKLSNSYTNAKNQLLKLESEDIFGQAVMTTLFTADPSEAKIILDPNHARYAEVMEKHGLDPRSAQKTFGEKLKFTGDVFGQMVSNTKKYFSDTAESFGKWKKIKSWKGFKGKLAHSLKEPMEKLSNVKRFITDSEFRKFTVKNFKLDWSQGLMTTIGIIFDIIQIATNKLEWYKVSKEIRKAREKYEEYVADLKNELASLEPEERQMNESWVQMAEAFTNFSKSFQEVLTYGNKNKDFNDVVGLPAQPVSTDSPIFTVDFDNIDRTNILPNQVSVIDFLKSINNDLKSINEEFWARNALYQQALNQSVDQYSIKEILNDLKTFYSLNPSAILKDFGTQLTKKDLVCSVAKVRIELDEYNYYPLTTFRPRCEVSDDTFQTMEAFANKKQNMKPLYDTVKDQMAINDNQPLSSLFAAVQNAYTRLRDPQMQAFGSTLTDQDVVCAVAHTFPDRTDYNFISLSPFRPDCSAVSESEFATMKANAKERENLVGQVSSSLNICKLYNFCPCPAMMAAQIGSTEEDVIVVIKHLEPDREQYCGTTGCACVDLGTMTSR